MENRRCEICGRPALGPRGMICPHAVDRRYDCPEDPDRDARRRRLRRCGR